MSVDWKRIVLLSLLVSLCAVSLAQAAEYKLGEKNWKIAVAQRNLAEAGYKPDRSDGVLTAETVTTLKSFQQKMNLPVTGQLDDKTYQALAQEAYRKQAVAGVKGSSVVATAARFKGTPYRFGGVTPDKGFDCSGYVSYVFAQNKVSLPRTADLQYNKGLFVLRSALRPGDLVFFTTTEPGPSQVGIYAGNGSFWHASSHGVMQSGLDEVYWKPRYLGARRILLE